MQRVPSISAKYKRLIIKNILQKMGSSCSCNCSCVYLLADEEKYIRRREDELGIGRFPTENLDLAIRQVSKNNKISLSRWQEICNMRGLPYSDSSGRIQSFYSCFQDVSDSSLNTEKLLTLNILLSSASQRDKGRFLFEVYDSAGSNSLSSEQVAEMITNIFEICCDYVSKLIPPKVESIDIRSLHAYLQALRFKKSDAIMFYCKEIMGWMAKSIQKEIFMEAVIEAQINPILSSRTFRKSVFDMENNLFKENFNHSRQLEVHFDKLT